MPTFSERHPFVARLLRLCAYIIVGYNALVFAMGGPFIALMILGIMLGGSSSTEEADTLAGREVVYGEGVNELLSLKITGPILGEAEDIPFVFATGETYGYEVKEKLFEAATDPTVNGVILEINSPGGTIFGSRAIADGVKYFKQKSGKPVYAYIQGMGASGAYWAAAAADKIFADYGSDIGSIGVIMGPFKYYDTPVSESGGVFGGGVLTQNGIETVYLSAGKSKDLGNPYRRMTPDEVRILQGQVNNEYDNFVRYVADRRNIPEASLRNIVGAMSYDNKTAESYKLIDKTASREDTYHALADEAGIKGEFRVVRESMETGFWDAALGVFQHKPERKANAAGPCPLAGAHLAYAGNVLDLCEQ
jgi:protease-4